MTKRILVATALRNYLEGSETDEGVLYRRLDRHTQAQEDINERIEMLGAMLIQFLSFFFQLWPDMTQEDAMRRREKAPELLRKFLSTYARAAKNPSVANVLDPRNLDDLIRTNRSKNRPS